MQSELGHVEAPDVLKDKLNSNCYLYRLLAVFHQIRAGFLFGNIIRSIFQSYQIVTGIHNYDKQTVYAIPESN